MEYPTEMLTLYYLYMAVWSCDVTCVRIFRSVHGLIVFYMFGAKQRFFGAMNANERERERERERLQQMNVCCVVYECYHSVGIKWMPDERKKNGREREKVKKHVEVNKQNRSDRPKESYGKESVTLWTISTATNTTSKLKLKNKIHNIC